MYLRTGLLTLLLLFSVQAKRKTPLCAVAGRWQLDKVRSPEERADNLVWTLRVTRKGVFWDEEVTHKGRTRLHKHIYKLGRSEGEYDKGRKWFFNVEHDKNRLLIQRRFFFPSELIQRWTPSVGPLGGISKVDSAVVVAASKGNSERGRA